VVFLVTTNAAFSQAALNCDEIVCGNGIYVRLTNGSPLTSIDRFEWTDRPLGVRTFLRGVTFGNGIFVSVGGSYLDVPAVIFTSRDGITWVRRSCPAKRNLYAVTFADGLFVAVGDEGTICISADGLTWKVQCSPSPEILLAAVASGNGTFVAGGESGAILTSTNGVDWIAERLEAPIYIASMKFRNGMFVAASGAAAFVSRNGLVWRRCSSTNL
jgi:hypothetical protein